MALSRRYKHDEHQLDNILHGPAASAALRGHAERAIYLKAATLLYDQLEHQPRNAFGGFWHKQRYPNQMWLDGLYMAEPFYAEYASISHHPEEFDDITHQFVLIEEHARDAKTGLLYHGWDESKQQRWANKQTGDSPEFWARAMGWYMMALVDTLRLLSRRRPRPRATDCDSAARSGCGRALSGSRRPASGTRCIDKPGAKGQLL